MADRSDDIVTPINLQDYADPSYQGAQEALQRQQAIDAGVGLSDIGHTFAGATAGLGAGLMGYAERWGMLTPYGQQQKEYLKEQQRYQQEQLSPSAQEEGEESLFSTAHPVRHLTLGLTSMAPSLIASAVPGAMVARALGVTSMLGATAATAAGSAPVSASMAGDVFNAIQDEVKNTPDDKLRRDNPFYNGLRADGMPEDQARAKTVDYITGWKPEIVGAAAELANRFGPAFKVATTAAGIAGKGVIRGALTGAAEQTISQGLLGGVQAGVTQEGKREVHPDLEFQWNDVLKSAVESGALGGLTGLATGAIAGRQLSGNVPAPKKTPNMDQDAATAVAALPQSKPKEEAGAGPLFASTEAPPAGEAEEAPAPPPKAGVHTEVGLPGEPDPNYLATQVEPPGKKGAAPPAEAPEAPTPAAPAQPAAEAKVEPAAPPETAPSPKEGVVPETPPSPPAETKAEPPAAAQTPAEMAKTAGTQAQRAKANVARIKQSLAEIRARQAGEEAPAAAPTELEAQRAKVKAMQEELAAKEAKLVPAKPKEAAEPKAEAQPTAEVIPLKPRVLPDVKKEARARPGERVSAPEAGSGAAIKAFASSGDAAQDLQTFKSWKDRRKVKLFVKNAIAEAEKAGREPEPLHVQLQRALEKNMQGRGPEVEKNRQDYMNLRADLAREQSEKLAAGKTERGTAEAQATKAKEEEAAAHAAQGAMAAEVIKAHEPPDPSSLPTVRQHIDDVLSAAKKAGVELPLMKSEAKGEPHLEHLAELNQLQELLKEKDWGKLSAEQAANRALRVQDAVANAELLRKGETGAVKERRQAQALKKEATLEEGTPPRIEASYEGPLTGEHAAPDEGEALLPKAAAERQRQLAEVEKREAEGLAKEKAEEARRAAEREASRKAREEAKPAEPAQAPAAMKAREISKRRGKTTVTFKGKPKEVPKADLAAELKQADQPIRPPTSGMPAPKETAADRAALEKARQQYVRFPKMPVRDLSHVARPIRTPDPLTGLEDRAGRVLQPLTSVKLADLLRSTAKTRSLSNMLKGLEWLQNTMRERVIQLVGDMPVHVLSDADHIALVGKEIGGNYNNAYHYITLPEKTFRGNDTYLHMTALHEAIHAAFNHLVWTTPALEKEIEKLISHIGRYKDRLTKQGFTERDFYGITDTSEFLSEAFANPRFQEILHSIPMPRSREMTQALMAAKGWPGLQTAWHELRFLVRKALGLKPHHDSVLDRAMDVAHLADYIRQDKVQHGEPVVFQEEAHPESFFRADPTTSPIPRAPSSAALRPVDPTQPVDEQARTHLEKVKDTVTRALSGTSLSDFGRKALAYVTSDDQYRQRTEKLFRGEGKDNVIHDLHYAMMEKGHYADELKRVGEDLGADFIDAREKVGTETFNRFENLLMDSSWNGMDPSQALGQGRNAHLGISKGLAGKVKKQGWAAVAHEASMEGWQARGKWEKLNSEYNNLVAEHPEFAKLMQRSFDYFAGVQHDMARGGIENLLEGNLYRGDIKAKAQELLEHRGGQEWKDATEKEFGEDFLAEVLRQRDLDVKKGPYFPFMRRGNWVTHGRYNIEAPANATRLSHNEFEFATRKEAYDFVAEHDLHASNISTRYYNPDDPSLGAEAGKRTTREGLTSAGNPTERTYVRLEDQYVKFHPTEKEARADYEMLKNSGLMREVYTPEVRQNGVFQNSELTRSTLQLIDKRLQQNNVYKAAGEGQRQAMRQALQEASLAARAGIRMQHRRLPRRHVLGASNDVVQGLYEYNNSQGAFRAMQKYRPLIDDALKRMRQEQQDRRNEVGNTERSIAAAEWEKRSQLENPDDNLSKWSGVARRITMLSYLDRMGRPSHLILHQTHLPMITAPELAGRHGLQAYAEVMKAWRGASGAYKTGALDTIRSTREALPKWIGGKGRKALTYRGTDYDSFMDNAFKGEKDGNQLLDLFDTARKANLMHITGGVEVGKYGPTSHQKGFLASADRVLAKMDTIYRHASNAADSMIRHAALVAAYRLERDKLTSQGNFMRSEVHEKAKQYAMDIVANTQGNYAVNNAAPIFRNKYLRPFLQFRQFPQMMYHLLIKNTVNAFKGEDRETRAQAAKSLFAILGSHVAMTGLLGGLPMELPRAMLATTKGLGLTSFDMQDAEDKAKDAAHAALGQIGGDLLMHGLTRAIGIDAHHRLGLNSFFTFGIDDVHDWNSFAGFMFNQPAPIGLAKDWAQGVTRMMKGDIEGGLAKAFPMEALRDIKKAWTGEGAGGYELSPAERALALTGFTSAGAAQYMEDTRRRIREAEEKKDERSRTQGTYLHANTPEQIKAATKAIEEFNKTATARNRIGIKGLEAIKKSRKKQMDEARSMY